MNPFDIDTAQLQEVKVKLSKRTDTLSTMANTLFKQPRTHIWLLGEIVVQGIQMAVILVEWYDPITNRPRREITECNKQQIKIVNS